MHMAGEFNVPLRYAGGAASPESRLGPGLERVAVSGPHHRD